MKKIQSLPRRLDSTLALAAAVGAVAVPAVSKAAVVFSGPLNISIPATADGIYVNFITGLTGTTAASVPGYDWNPYGSTALLFYWGGTGALNSGVASTTTGPYLVLQPGAMISSGSTFSQSANGANNETAAFRAGVNGYLGVQFRNETTGIQNFGYVHLQTTGTSGYPATILDWAYDNTGAAITIVPEPATTSLLGALALGALGVRAWKRRQA